MTDDAAAVRWRSITDRLEQLVADAERYREAAWDAGNVDEAVRMFTLAAALRGTLAMVGSS